MELFYLHWPLGGAVSFGTFFVFPSLASRPWSLIIHGGWHIFFLNTFFMMAEDSESAASQQSLELDDQDTCGIDGDNEEENEHMQG